MPHTTPPSLHATPGSSPSQNGGLWLLLWICVVSMLVLGIVYFLLQSMRVMEEHTQTIEQLTQKADRADRDRKELEHIRNDTHAQHFLTQLETFMPPHTISDWCQNIPQHMGLTHASPLLEVQCHATHNTHTPLFHLLHILMGNKNAQDTSLYQPIQLRIAVKTYSEGLFFEILNILRTKAPFYGEIHNYTLSRMESPQHESFVPESIQEAQAPFFQGVIDMHALSLWDEDHDDVPMTDHDAMTETESIEPHTDPPSLPTQP